MFPIRLVANGDTVTFCPTTSFATELTAYEISISLCTCNELSGFIYFILCEMLNRRIVLPNLT